MIRVKTALAPLCLGLMFALPVQAQSEAASAPVTGETSPSETEFTPPPRLDDCAELAEGVKRLACYDHFLQTDGADPLDTGVDPELVDAAQSLGVDADKLDEPRKPSLINRILARQRALFSYSGNFVKHRANYLLPITYVDPINSAPMSANFGREPLQEDLANIEAKFQISVRMPILTGLFNDRTTLWVAYTQLSFWQAYNSDESSPFRESNYEPEIFLSYQPGLPLGPGSIDLLSVGFNHQSNGRSDPFSRSWNRLLANIVYSDEHWVFAVTPWYRIPESSREDNNPDIHQYLGYADYTFSYQLPNETTIGLLFRNNLDDDHNRSTFRLDYAFPLSESVSAYVQYYHGWGESLIDYNQHVKRIGVGITIADWL